jgi:hypothetical protein
MVNHISIDSCYDTRPVHSVMAISNSQKKHLEVNINSIVVRHPLDQCFLKLAFQNTPIPFPRPPQKSREIQAKQAISPEDMINTSAVNEWLEKNTSPPLIDHFL